MKLTTAPIALLSLAATLGLYDTAEAQAFNYDRFSFPPQTLLTFRQTGAANEMVVNLGSVDRFYNAAPGSRTVLADYPTGLLVSGASACFSTLDGVRFSVLSAVRGVESTNRPLQTLWVTRPRPSDALDTQTQPWPRRTQSSLGLSAARVANIGVNAAARGAAAELGLRNATNRIVYPGSAGLGSLSGGLDSNLGAAGNLSSTMPSSIEAVAPVGFSDSGKVIRADFYEVRPSSQPNDPSLYLGYFELASSGALSFVAAGGNPVPPTAPIIRSISRSGSITSIIVSSEVGVLYSLARSNPTAWTPVAQWAGIGSEVVGTGADMTLTDNSASDLALYVVRARR